MSKRDTRFKPLRWRLSVSNPNNVWVAAGLSTVYYIVQIDDAYLILGCNDPDKAEQYYYMSDAKTIAQLDHEARLKEWLQ